MSNKITYYLYENKKGGSYKYYFIFHYPEKYCSVNYGRIDYGVFPSWDTAADKRKESTEQHKDLTTLRKERERNGYELVQIGFLKP